MSNPVSTTYPIVSEVQLGPPERGRFWGGQSRQPDSLPLVGAHEVMVATIDGHPRKLPARHYRGDESEIVEATTISVVDVSDPRIVTVEIEIPSLSDAEEFTISVGFKCRVTDAVTVVSRGVRDLSDQLKAYLRSFPELMSIGSSFYTTDLSSVRAVAPAALETIGEVEAFSCPGMAVEISNWHVSANGVSRQHANERDNLRRKREIDRERRELESEERQLEDQKAALERNRVRVRLVSDGELESLRLRQEASAAQQLADLRLTLQGQGRLAEFALLENALRSEMSPAAAAERVRELIEAEKLAEQQRSDAIAEIEQADRQRELEYQRKREATAEEREARDEEWRRTTRFELLKVMSNRGAMDLRPEFVESLVDDVLGIVGNRAPALTDGGGNDRSLEQESSDSSRLASDDDGSYRDISEE